MGKWAKIKQKEELIYQKRNSDSLVRQIPAQQFDKINSSAKLLVQCKKMVTLNTTCFTQYDHI